MTEIPLRYEGLVFISARRFIKGKGSKKNSKKQMALNRYIRGYKKLNKVCFQFDITYNTCKDLLKKRGPYWVSGYKGFGIAPNPEYNRYQGWIG